MRVILYIATSIDGYIARPDGSIDWLESVESEDKDYGYSEFFNSVDMVVMGRKTFEQVLQFGEWPYAGKQTVVFSRQPQRSTIPDVQFFNGTPETLSQHIKTNSTVWLAGGGQLNNLFLKSQAIDEIILSIIPVCLGDGIPLFCAESNSAFIMIKCRSFHTGVVQIHYHKDRNKR